MKAQNVLFLIIGLVAGLLIGGGAYFLATAHQPISNPPDNSSVAAITQVSPPESSGMQSAPFTNPAPVVQVPATSATAPSYQYDSHGQLLVIIYPDGSRYSYHYNDKGDKISETTQTGKTWCYLYDHNHHPLTIIDPEGRMTLTKIPGK